MTAATVSTIPAVVPMLAYEDPAAAIDWLTRAFGFREQTGRRVTNPDGVISHAQLEAGAGLVMLAAPTPDYESPARHRVACQAAARWLAVPWVIDGVLVQVDDIAAHYERARAAGATLLSGLEDAPYGRLYRVEDLEGHRWMFSEPMAG